MGAECPNSHGRQFIVANITADGEAPTKAGDVIAQKLACGCVVGGPEYEKFQADVQTLRLAEKKAIQELKEKTRQKLGAIFRAYTQRGE